MAELIQMPRISLNEESSIIGEFYVQEGMQIKKGEPLFSVETDKSTMDVYAERDATVLKIFFGNGDIVNVLEPVCCIGDVGEEVPEYSPVSAASEEKAEKPSADAKIAGNQPVKPVSSTGVTPHLSPRAKRLAELNGLIDFSKVKATGANGRIVSDDVCAFLAAAGSEAAEVGTAELDGEICRFSKIRSVIAQNMMSSLHNSAQLTLHCEVDASALQRCRENYKKSPDATETQITIGDLLMYAAIKTLSQHPEVNATIGEGFMVKHRCVNLGFATDTERGLMVPTIFAAHKKTLREISAEAKALALECRSGKIDPAKLHDGTFTITNLGSFGIKNFTPIINPPQAAILGIGCIYQSIRSLNGKIEIFPAMALSLTIDHRVIDGGPGAKFMKDLCANIESIEELVNA